jgi:hypothetical protein
MYGNANARPLYGFHYLYLWQVYGQITEAEAAEYMWCYCETLLLHNLLPLPLTAYIKTLTTKTIVDAKSVM